MKVHKTNLASFFKIKLFIFTILVLLVSTFPTFTAYAWAPNNSFYLTIEKEKIPSGTKFIDMLLPINENDKYYVPYSVNNLSQFNIAKESEIVTYNKDGYRSYTFHISDSNSQMQPEVLYYFNITEDEYNTHKELLSPFISSIETAANGDFFNGLARCNVPIYLYSDEYNNFWNVISNIKTNDFQEYSPTVNFNDYSYYNNHNEYFGPRNASCDYEYCCSTYKKVKFAYIDGSGNILGVSNVAPIYKRSISTPGLSLSLSGLKLSSDFSYGPPLGILMYMSPFFVICISIGTLIVVISVIREYRKARKKY